VEPLPRTPQRAVVGALTDISGGPVQIAGVERLVNLRTSVSLSRADKMNPFSLLRNTVARPASRTLSEPYSIR
jgi:hypothetical protein